MIFFIFCLIVLSFSGDVYDYDVIVIGSGISGMSAASALTRFGKKVLVLEKSVLGGSLQTFTRTGQTGMKYHWDIGTHFLGNMGSFLFKFLSNSVTFHELDPISDLFMKGENESYVGYKWPRLKTEIIARYPEEEEAVTKFFSSIINLSKSNAKKMINDFAIECGISDLDLIYIITHQCFNCTVSLFSTLFNYYYVSGTIFPVGSSDSIIMGAKNLIESIGGKVIANMGADKLITDENDVAIGVETQYNNYYAPYIIAACAVKNIFNEDFMGAGLLERKGYTSETLNYTYGATSMTYFFGFNATNDKIGLPATNINYSVNNPLKNGQDFLDRINGEIGHFFATSTSERDPEYHDQYDGTTVFGMSTAYIEWFQNWTDSETGSRPLDYYEYKDKFLEEFKKVFFELFPKAEQYLDVAFAGSPLTVRDYLTHPMGQVYGTSKKQEWYDYKTNIKGLWMCGQDILSYGVFPSLGSGLTVALYILRDQYLGIVIAVIVCLGICCFCCCCVLVGAFVVCISLIRKKARRRKIVQDD